MVIIDKIFIMEQMPNGKPNPDKEGFTDV